MSALLATPVTAQVRDDAKKLHPMLIPYDELSDVEKAYDLDMALGTLKVRPRVSMPVSLMIFSVHPFQTVCDIHLIIINTTSDCRFSTYWAIVSFPIIATPTTCLSCISRPRSIA